MFTQFHYKIFFSSFYCYLFLKMFRITEKEQTQQRPIYLLIRVEKM